MLKIGNLFSKKNKKKKKVKKLSIKARILSFIWSLFWKVSLVSIATMLILGIYFDSKIERKFAAGTWQLACAKFMLAHYIYKLGDALVIYFIN